MAFDAKLSRAAVSIPHSPFNCGDGCPSDQAAGQFDTNYVAIVGPGAAWPGGTCTKISDFKDGITNKILLVEVVNPGIAGLSRATCTSSKCRCSSMPRSAKDLPAITAKV
jgi:hypothetical protein